MKPPILKRTLSIIISAVLVISVSAATAVIVSKKRNVTAATKIKNGMSAYELAVKSGYKGNMSEWLVSLKGKSAYETAKEAGFEGTENEYNEAVKNMAQNKVNIKTASFNDEGQLLLTMSDNTVLNLGRAVGLNGSDGKNGTNGKDGVNGKDGKDGKDGIGISDAKIENGEFILKFTNGETVNLGGITGMRGEKGYSAYEIALMTGSTTAATETEWIASLKGEKGDTGAVGATGATGAKGDKGAKGEKGDKGEQGLKGDTGATGAKGEKGDTGATGAKGEKGDKGDKGDTGLTGATGAKGDTGEKGADGKSAYEIAKDNGFTGSKSEWLDSLKGLDGSNGKSAFEIAKLAGLTSASSESEWIASLKGAKGDKGDTGATGATGAQGEKGDKGDKGDSGDTGAQGEKGEQGLKGDTGAKGDNGKSAFEIAKDNGFTGTEEEWLNSLKGAKGDTGAQGEKGDKGDKGDTGATGAQGDKGDKGDTGAAGAQGADGESAYQLAVKNGIIDTSVSEIEWLNSLKGSNGAKGNDGVGIKDITIDDTTGKMTITLTDTTKQYVFNVKGPKGEKGDKGDKGDTGATGVQGEKGDKGDKGDTGATGAQGEKGDKGDKGDTGATGAQGEKGDKGDKGDTGATGAQGEKGDKGDKGDTGATGAQGEKGASVENVTVDENDYLVVTLSDGNIITITKSLRGAKGETGNGIKTIELTSDYKLKISYTDTSKADDYFTLQKGDKGEKGDSPILSYNSATGELLVKYSESETPVSLGVVKGKDGVDGKDAYELYKAAHPEYTGTQEQWLASLTGRGIEKTEIINGELIITYTDGTKDIHNLTGITANQDEILTFTALENGTYSVKQGKDIAFYKNIEIPEYYKGRKVTVIESNAFYSCKSLESIAIPETIISIGIGAFSNCSNLCNITLPSQLTSIPQSAFRSCTNLTTISIPENVTTIGKEAFLYSGLSTAQIDGTWKYTVDSVTGTAINDDSHRTKTFKNVTFTLKFTNAETNALYLKGRKSITEYVTDFYKYSCTSSPAGYELKKQ